MHNPFKYKEKSLLTVEKLIEKLKDLPPNMKVCVRNKYVSETDILEDYVIHQGNAFDGSDGNFHIYF